MTNAVAELDRILRSEAWYDLHVVSCDETTLEIHGTLDITYGHNLEITFDNVRYLDVSMHWKTDTKQPWVVRVADKAELSVEQSERYFANGPGEVFEFVAEGIQQQHRYRICAEAMRYVHKGRWESWAWYDSPNPPPVAGGGVKEE